MKYINNYFNKNIVGVLLLIFIGFTSSAQWIQLGNDIDGETAYDYSGYSVSLNSNGTIVAIGAYYHDGNGMDASGQVRVYYVESDAWIQLGDVINGEAPYDNSGYSVSLSSDGMVVAIGAPYNNGNGAWSGHVRVYKYISGNWVQLGDDIDGEADNDWSGYSVSLSSDGRTVAIGAPSNSGGSSEAGQVRVYEFVSGAWIQKGGDIDGEAYDDLSGYSVSLNSDGSIVAIGTPYNDGNGNMSGHTRIYQFIGGVWSQLGDDIDGESALDESGWSVDLSSDGLIVAIGARYNNDGGNHAGQVRVYKFMSGNWIQQGNDIDGEAGFDESGSSVSLSSDGLTLAIGAKFNDGSFVNAGHVRVYQYISNEWIQQGDDIDGESVGDWSGVSISLSSDGSTLAIGANGNDGNGTDSGHVRVYKNELLGVIDNSLNEEVSVYPNPSKDIFTIDFKNIYPIVVLNLIDISGRIIQSKICKGNKVIQLNMSENNSGVYFIEIITDNKKSIFRLQKI